jgi:cell fate regulator YaaT (PSP1 superfamily)
MRRFPIVEVKFKGGQKEYFRNEKDLDLITGDPVVVQTQKGWHVGHVSLQGELVRLRLRKHKIKNTDKLPEILRIADERELEKLTHSQHRELPTLYRTREIVQELGLKMKLSDVEFQADNSKATFFYSAEHRVDFRELIKRLASEFKIRVEMRQISLREEAGRIGGIGACGRELCCSTWLTDFKSVSTGAARYQNLSLNPNKISGQCGRLKCCLNYELDTYIEALQDIPKVNAPLITEKGKARLQKTDIFKKVLWFAYEGENTWHPVPAERVREVMALNKKGENPEVLLTPELEARMQPKVVESDDFQEEKNALSHWDELAEPEKKADSELKKEEASPTAKEKNTRRRRSRGRGRRGGSKKKYLKKTNKE